MFMLSFAISRTSREFISVSDRTIIGTFFYISTKHYLKGLFQIFIYRNNEVPVQGSYLPATLKAVTYVFQNANKYGELRSTS